MSFQEDVATAIKLAKRGYKGPEASCVEKLSSLATQQVLLVKENHLKHHLKPLEIDVSGGV